MDLKLFKFSKQIPAANVSGYQDAGLNGIDVLRKLQRNRKDVRVVVITATNQENTEEEAISMGAMRYLRKPLDIFEMIESPPRYFANPLGQNGFAKYRVPVVP